MDTSVAPHILIILSRVFEMLSFGVILLFVFKGIPVRYIFIVASITLIGIFASVINFFTKAFSTQYSFAFESFAFILVLSVAFYAFMEKREKRFLPPPQPPDGTRCPVCSAFVKKEDDYCVAKEGDELLYFDSCEHLKRFLEDFQAYVNLRRLRIKKIERVYKKGEKKWIELNQ